MTKHILPAIFLLGLTTFCSAESGAVGKQTRAWRTQHEKEILAEFTNLLAIPNIAGDDKTPIIGMLAALDALKAAGMKPAVNLRFIFEGEEEAGSPHLADYLAKYPDQLRPTAWVLCDGPIHQSRRMELSFGARGTLGLDLTTYGPVKGLHDGHYGNWVPNPIVRLTHLLDSMRDENGKILIAGSYDGLK